MSSRVISRILAMTSGPVAIVGALACQKNSFAKLIVTNVISCSEYSLPANKKGSKPQPAFAIELHDTVLFPEGGGQPADSGSLALEDGQEVIVSDVVRDQLRALHICESPISVGTQVLAKINWPRRLDIMQQHTGQHLLSAVLDQYDLPTLGWAMGDPYSYVELPRKLDDHFVAIINEQVNQLIFEGKPISVQSSQDHASDIDLSKIPDDYDKSMGVIRVVTIDGIDANPCCGTHLLSTAQIQAIALLHQQSCKGGHSRLFFSCGARVGQLMRQQYLTLKQVCGTQLSCQMSEVEDKVATLNANYRKAQNREQSLIKELAALEAKKVYDQFETIDVRYVYRRESDPDFLTQFHKELMTLINSKEKPVNLTDKNTIVELNGDHTGKGGMVKICGPQAEVILAQLKERIANIKGGGKGAAFQGKISSYERGEIESVIHYLDSLAI